MMTCNWQDHLDYLEMRRRAVLSVEAEAERARRTAQTTDLRDIIATMKRIEAQQEQALSDLRSIIRSLERDE